MKLISFMLFFASSVCFSDDKVILNSDQSMRHLTREAYERKLVPNRWLNQESTSGNLKLETIKLKQSNETQSLVQVKGQPHEKPWQLDDSDRRFRTNLAMFAGPTLILAYGALFWDWGRTGLKFGTRDEGWFQRNTYAGGADKFAHAWSHFMITRGYYNLFTEMGWSPQEANLRAMLGASATGLFIEIGDGMSRYGFSSYDLAVDIFGIAFAGLLNAYPSLDELIGFQINYWNNTSAPEGQRRHVRDPIDDYNNQKYVLNLRMSGIPIMQDYWFTRYFSLDVGYYTRGYDDDINNPNHDPLLYKRNTFIGASLNLWKLIEDPNPKGTFNTLIGSLFKYVQTPLNSYEFHADEAAGKGVESLAK